MYDVRLFVVNGDTIASLWADTLRWRDVIVDNATQGSVGTTDALCWQRYRRGHVRYTVDTASRTLAVRRGSFLLESTHAFTARYELPDRETARLWTAIRDDSVYVELVRSDRRFQLAERQCHGLSKWNR